jgi:hypothetical protein
LFNIRLPADLDSERLADQLLEWRRVSRCRPHLQLRVAGRPDLQQPVVSSIVELDAADGLGVTAIEALGQPEDRRERANRAAAPLAEIVHRAMALLRRGLPVVPRHERDRFDFVRLEPAKIAVLDQVIRVLVMAFVADVHADVVEDGGVLEPFALAIA